MQEMQFVDQFARVKSTVTERLGRVSLAVKPTMSSQPGVDAAHAIVINSVRIWRHRANLCGPVIVQPLAICADGRRAH
jgi:hypothetical protein